MNAIAVGALILVGLLGTLGGIVFLATRSKP